MPTPDLPLLTPDQEGDPMGLLSQKFGRETANYFSGSPLNRLSFLRGDRDFLRAAFSHPSTGFLLMKNLAPLVQKDDTSQLAFVSGPEVHSLTGVDPFDKTEEEQIRDYNSAEKHPPVVLFLGVDDRGVVPFSSSASQTGHVFEWKEFKGTAYFAVDVTPKAGAATATAGEEMKEKEKEKEEEEKERDEAKKVIESVATPERGFVFYESGRHMGLHAGQGIYLFSLLPIP